jgi:hypothetical protein
MSDLDLARRAVAYKRWRWMPGMLDLDGYRVISVCTDPGEPEPYCVVYAGGDSLYLGDICSEPDLADPATLGCLLALVREAYRDPSLSTRCRSTLRTPGVAESGMTLGPWDAASTSEHVTIGLHGTLAPIEAAALVAALEAAP